MSGDMPLPRIERVDSHLGDLAVYRVAVPRKKAILRLFPDHKELRRSLELADAIGGTVRPQDSTIRWPNGAQSYYKVITSEHGMDQIRGMEFSRVMGLEHAPSEFHDRILSRVRP